jgi:hypothetical protein
MPHRPTSFQLTDEVAALLDELATRRGLTKTQIIVLGILAQAEIFGLIPSLAEKLSTLFPDPGAGPDADLRRRQRLSQQRTRARLQGEPVPKLKPGRPPRRSAPP